MISLNPHLMQHLNAFKNEVIDSEDNLSERDKLLIKLALDYRNGDNTEVRKSIVRAKQSGLSNEEIGHVCAFVIATIAERYSELGQFVDQGFKTSQSDQCCQ